MRCNGVGKGRYGNGGLTTNDSTFLAERISFGLTDSAAPEHPDMAERISHIHH